MEFRMLGQPELWADGMRHDLGPRKERTVLAVLLYELPRAVPAETLVSRVWGDDPPDGVYNSLYSVVSRLRKRLGDASGLDGEALLPKRSGRYVLNVSRDQVDLWQFRALRDQARRAIGRDDELVVTLFNRAEALWRGAPLDGLDGDWAEAVRVTLGEERLSAALQCFRAGQRLGREADQVSDIAKLMDEYPGNENLLELYLLALYRSGRQPMALMTYRQAEQRWRDEYGMDLGSGLRDLQRLMLTADPILDAAPPSQESSRPAVADPVPPPMPPSTMRRDTPDFTGRGAELERLVSWLGLNPARPAAPVVVISGMAGVGKTALAVHAARQLRERYPEQAQVFLSLRANSASDAPVAPGAALGALLRRVGVPDSVIPVDVDDRAALLQFRLTGRNTLIVLDDALDAGQVLPLLPDVPDCMVLVTTRRRALSLPGMLAIQLDPMPHADAAALFARTAGASAGQAADQASVSRVARLCGRLPLRIRLAGGQLRRHPAWSVRDLASHLSDLGSDDPAMTAEFDLSYRYLTAQEAQLFRWLALHPGDSFSAHAAVALSGGTAPAATERALEVLLDYHLVEEPVPGRYTFHALLRSTPAAWPTALTATVTGGSSWDGCSTTT